MTNAVLEPPVHPKKQVKCFEDVSECDYDETSRAE